MSDPERGTDRGGQRARAFLTPLQKYEIFLHLVHREVTAMEAAEAWEVDPRPGHGRRHHHQGGGAGGPVEDPAGAGANERDLELEGARADAARLGEALKEMAVTLMVVEGTGRWGGVASPSSSGRGHDGGPPGPPDRGHPCRLELGLAEVRAYRWRQRRAGEELDDRAPGGHALYGLLPEEVARIAAPYHEWGEVDRSQPRLAHRGSHLWSGCSPASMRRHVAGQGLHLNPPPRPGRSVRTPFPDRVEYRPNQAWIYDTTHVPRARVAATVVEDLVPRTWPAHIASTEETATQVEIVVTDALSADGLLPWWRPAPTAWWTLAWTTRPVLVAVSDNGAQMTSGSTRELMARCAIALRHPPTRPGSRVRRPRGGGVPHLDTITGPGQPHADLALTRAR